MVKNLPARAGGMRNESLIPGLGRSPGGGGHGNPRGVVHWYSVSLEGFPYFMPDENNK